MRGSRSRVKQLRLSLVGAAVASCFASAGAHANPTMPQVVHGSVDVQGLGSSSVLVKNLGGTNAIINWKTFSIDATELTRFQQFANLAVLNRVTGDEMSRILGALRSDGRVLLINTNGIYVGPNALLDLPSLVASSLPMSNEDFLAGRLRFTEMPSAGRVENEGTITTASYPSGQVYLVGPAVANRGVITTPQGEVILAAGNSVELMNAGTPGVSVQITAPDNEVLNLGQLVAASGRVGIFGGVVNQGGLVSAGTAVAGADGSVRLVATRSTTFAPGSSTVVAGALDIETGDLAVSGNVQSGPQTVDASRGLVVRGGQLAASGGQTITAESVEVDGVAGSAGISNNVGEQAIVAQSVALRGGSATTGGSAAVNAFNGSQRVTAGSVSLTGGADGTNNFALLRALGGEQTIVAGEMALSAGEGGTSNFAAVIAAQQDVTVSRDVRISGGNSGSTPALGGGALIGGGGSLPTDLRLSAGGNLALIGGAQPGSGGAIGASNAGLMRTDITLNVGGDLTMTPGSGTGTRIGAPPANIAGGDLVISAGGTLAMNSASPERDAVIRTTGDVSLDAVSVTQGADARIEAGSLRVNTLQGASLVGDNSVSLFNASNSFGDVAFSNASALLTVQSAINPAGALRLQQSGDLRVTGTVASGLQTIDVSGGLVVQNEPFNFAQLGASGGQTINTGYVELNSFEGGSASIFNFSGEQRIHTSSANAAGEGLAVRAFQNGFALIDSPLGPQTIEVRNADRVVVDAAGGSARISAFDGPQSLVLSGAGANALQLQSAGFGQASISANDQSVRAGAPGESGSITIEGGSGAFGAGIFPAPRPGGQQSIATTGALTVTGARSAQGFDSGIFANGAQTVNAESIELRGGAEGTGNGAVIFSGGLSQSVSAGAGGILVAGGTGAGNTDAGIFGNNGPQSIRSGAGITLLGGAFGTGNFAQINVNNGPQQVTAGDILLAGGTEGLNNNALLRSSTGPQVIVADQVTLQAGTGGTANFAAIVAPLQDLTVHGDVSLTGGSSASSMTSGGGALIGGGANLSTNLVMDVGGSVTLNGGSFANAGAGIGSSSSTLAQRADVTLNVQGDVTLNPGLVAGAATRIGTRPGNVGGGEIVVNAGNTIALNSAGPGNAGAIRTTEGVRLTANRIEQGTDAEIEAGALGIETQQGASLVGHNRVSAFNATNQWFGDIALHNTSPLLAVSGVQNFAGGLSLQQAGNMLVNGNVFTGPQTIDVTGGLIVQNEPLGFATLGATGGQSIEAGYVEVNGRAGGGASISSSGGVQAITTTGTNASGEGLVVRNNGGFVATIDSFNGEQHVRVRNADRALLDGAFGPAQIVNIDGVQSVELSGAGANALVLGTPGGLGQSVIGGGGFQSVVAGHAGGQGSITLHGLSGGGFGNTLIVSNPVPGGTQTVSTPGAIRVLGGTSPGNPGAAGIFANGIGGQQTVSAESVLLQGGSTGSGNSAMIGANNGSQTINAGTGGITLRGGATGGSNFVQINQASTNPAASQTVRSAGPVLLEGGSGDFNFAMIRSFGGHQEFEAGNTTLLAGAGGIDNFATIQGRSQDVTVHGNLDLVARGSAGSENIGGGARIGGTGGGSPSPTDLRLSVDGNLTMTGGSVSGTGVLLGNTPVLTADTDIDVSVGGSVSLNGGSVPGTFAVIGSRAGNLAGGDISIEALNGTIALNSTAPDQAAIVRTTDAVSLAAQSITQGPDARVEAGSLSVNTQQGAALVGDNRVSAFSATNDWFGDVSLHNTSPLLTVTGVQNWNGGLTLRQAGDMRVNGSVFSGPQSIDVTGGLVVQNEPFGVAELVASGTQTIDAGYIEVNGVGGGQATISNFGGQQSISAADANAAGETLVVRGTDGGFASINGSLQSITLSGPGPNALVMGGPTGSGFSTMFGDVQTIVAGSAGEPGSITLNGPAAQIVGGTQTVSTSGALSLLGSPTVSALFSAGLFGIGIDGVQTVRADSILLQGGSAPGGNGALILAVEGSQKVEAGGGGITVLGGPVGTANFAIIEQASANPANTQTVTSSGPILLRGGDQGTGNRALIAAAGGAQTVAAGSGGLALIGGESGLSNFAQINQVSTDPAASQTVVSAGPVLLEGGSGEFNFAMIRSFGGHQEFEAGNTTLLAGAGGIDNFATIQGRSQDMTVHGNLDIVARGSAGNPNIGGGARIGGTGGGSPSPTDLRLSVDGNLTMTGGSVSGTGVLLGNTPILTADTDIDVRTGGNVSLNGGSVPGTFAVIGSRAGNLAGGTISIEALNGTIALNSTAPDQASIIRTTDAVSLAAQSITQGPDARVEAGSLSVNTQQGAALVGDNRVNEVAMLNSVSGDVGFNNASALLAVTGIDQVKHGALSITQSGDLLVNGDVSSGAQSISATGDMTVTPGSGSNVTVQAYGPQRFNVGGTFSLLGGTAWNGYAQTLAKGPVSITTGEDLRVRGGGGLLAYALLYGSDDLRLRVGDALRIDGGDGLLAFARVQTDFRDRIYLEFPNREQGGYFVNGREGVTHRGLDGLFTGLLPAIRGRSLVVSYGD